MKKNQPGFFWSLVFVASMFLGLAHGEVATARTNVTDWYIQDFDSKIVVNPDSTLDITETIVADCGTAVGKHGIFRILPTALTVGNEKIKMPVTLKSITDPTGKKYGYSTINNSSDGTVTWKIGDADVTVQGVNTYVIRYSVKNAIRFADSNFDELYWNLNGNFWDIETDRFHASLIFPQEITKDNTEISYYTGALGSKGNDLATHRWSAPNVLEFDSTKTLRARQGITASVTFPKNIIAPYEPNFWEKFGEYFFLLIPIAIFIICFGVWKKYGDDPEMDKTVIAEYSAPGDLSPIEMGMLMKNGNFPNNLVTAEIINLAVKGLLTIKQTEEKILLFTSKDYVFEKQSKPETEEQLNGAQLKIYDALFSGEVKTTKLSSLKNRFYKHTKKIRDAGEASLEQKGLIVVAGSKIGMFLKVFGGFVLSLSIPMFAISGFLSLSLMLSGILLLGFGFIMPKRTLAGVELNWQIKGFKLFMETVDKDRAPFYEKENIFEKFLPYAILFGMTKEWISRMREIYGADFYATHAPAWYAGQTGSFDADSFSSNLDSLSSAISSNTSAPSGSGSGSGGSGGSGGGGGGGGGGGW